MEQQATKVVDVELQLFTCSSLPYMGFKLEERDILGLSSSILFPVTVDDGSVAGLVQEL